MFSRSPLSFSVVSFVLFACFEGRAQSAKELLIFGDEPVNGLDCADYSAERIVIQGTIKIVKSSDAQKTLIVRCEEIEFRAGAAISIDSKLLFISKRVLGPVKIMNSPSQPAARGKDAPQLTAGYADNGEAGEAGKHGRAGTPCLPLTPVVYNASPGQEGGSAGAGARGLDGPAGAVGGLGVFAPEVTIFLGGLARGSTVDVTSLGAAGGNGGHGGNGENGGHGGKGGNGGDGGSGDACHHPAAGGKGGDGGDGGPGGQGGAGGRGGTGGAGGNVSIFVAQSPANPKLVLGINHAAGTGVVAGRFGDSDI
jgi:hypothetical protein